METPSIQPSFIPRGTSSSGPLARPKQRMGFFTTIAVVVFIVVALAYGGLWFYKGHLTASNNEKKAIVEEEINSFDSDVTRQLTTIKQKLDLSKKLLNNHVAVSSFFTLLENITAQTVRFSELDLLAVPGEEYSIIMKGESISYAAAAFQSDIFAKNQYLISPIFSNLNINEKGIIGFDVRADLNPKVVSYTELVHKTLAPAPVISEPIVSTTSPSASSTTPSTP